MNRIAFGGTNYADLAAAVMLEAKETCAVLLASPSSAVVTRSNLLVREIHPAPEQAYAIRCDTKAQLRPQFLVPLVQRARQNRLSVIFVHTHPFAEGTPIFSPVDDDGEKHLAEFMSRRVPGVPHGALVVGPDGC